MLPQSAGESSAYIKSLGLTIPAVEQTQLQDLKVTGTPTLFVVNARGSVEKILVGKLKEPEQQEILSLLEH